MSQISPPDYARAVVYEQSSSDTMRLLHADGSVSDGSAQILPPDSARATEYANASPRISKWLLADGSVVDSLNTGSGGSIDIAIVPISDIEAYWNLASAP
jgi:hypothetical protein